MPISDAILIAACTVVLVAYGVWSAVRLVRVEARLKRLEERDENKLVRPPRD